MPFINTKTTVSLTPAQKNTLTGELCGIARECLGKGENWVMTGYEDQVSLTFQGNSTQVAYVEVKTFGKPAAAGCQQMSARICALLERELRIPADHVYIAYFSTDQWGWNGNNF